MSLLQQLSLKQSTNVMSYRVFNFSLRIHVTLALMHSQKETSKSIKIELKSILKCFENFLSVCMTHLQKFHDQIGVELKNLEVIHV